MLLLLSASLALGAEESSSSEQFRGLILSQAGQPVLPEGDPALAQPGVQLKEVPRLDVKSAETAIAPLLGQPINDDLLKQLQQTLLKLYRKTGYPVVDLIFPPQTVSHGVLQIQVLESKLGQIQFESTNRWTKTEYLRKNLRLAEGDPIHEPTLVSDINWLNRNRFRTLDVFFKPGSARGESDLVVRSQERPPLGALAGFDNTGTRLTGENRFYVGGEWGKAFGLHDHSLTYRYISDTDVEFLQAHAVNYTAPLPWRHLLVLGGTYSEVTGDLGSSPLTQEGESYQAFLRYGIPLPNIRSYRHELSLGADYRRLDNSLEFNFINVLADTTEIAQGVFGYTGMLPDAWGSTFMGAELTWSPGNLGGLNTDEAFSNSYPFAEADYVYAKFNLERLLRLPAGFTFRATGAYQIADGNLLPSEQLGLGGSQTVRGYEERAASGTEGFLGSLELRAPSFSPGRWLDKSARDELQLLGFFDYGEIGNRILLRNEDRHITLKSVGVGLRYQVSRFVNVRFDYGWQLEDPRSIRNSSNSRGHVVAELRF